MEQQQLSCSSSYLARAVHHLKLWFVGCSHMMMTPAGILLLSASLYQYWELATDFILVPALWKAMNNISQKW